MIMVDRDVHILYSKYINARPHVSNVAIRLISGGLLIYRKNFMPPLVNNVQATTRSAKVPYSKPSLTTAEQLIQLQSRGLIIDDVNRVEELLSHINYFRLEAYWYPFYDNSKVDHFFLAGTTFNCIWGHYRFDRRLRAHIAYALERIEVSFRTQYAYYLSQYYGPFPFNINNLQFTSSQWQRERPKLVDMCHDSKELFAKHFFEKYSDDLLPVWALVEIQSFGALVFYYKRIKSMVVKSQISNVFGLNPRELTSWLEHLYYIRNTCAHHCRLWNKRFTILPCPPQRTISQDLNLRWNFQPLVRHSQDPFNERRLLNTILIIDYFLSKICPNNTWRIDLVKLINNYSMDAKKMGFLNGWEYDTFWN